MVASVLSTLERKREGKADTALIALLDVAGSDVFSAAPVGFQAAPAF
jgi:hypothetical protein